MEKLSEVIKRETKRRKVKFWGRTIFIKPAIHPDIFGDGLQLAFLGTIDQRPHYWLIRVDSGLNLESDDFNYDEHLLTPLEDAFGRVPQGGFLSAKQFKEYKKNNNHEVEDYDTLKEYNQACEYPALSWSGGHWGSIINTGHPQALRDEARKTLLSYAPDNYL